MTLKTYSLQPDIVEDLSRTAASVILKTWRNNAIELSTTGTHFGYVYHGTAFLSRQTSVVRKGMLCPHPLIPRLNHVWQLTLYSLACTFASPGSGKIGGEGSSGFVVTHLNYRGVFSLGGVIESVGRFAYIDGGTSSLLISPVTLGDPCLNAMYLPPRTDQTWHTHPSDRIGIVVEGEGQFETQQGITEAQPGTVFWIPANIVHKFRTTESKLILVAFHPDSDTGFTHRDNPMLNRTLVNGVSASELPQIQTEIWEAQ